MGRRPGGVVILTTRGSRRSDVVDVAAPYSALPVRATKRRLRLIANNALVYSSVSIDRWPCSDVVDVAAPYSALPARATKRRLRPIAKNALV